MGEEVVSKNVGAEDRAQRWLGGFFLYWRGLRLGCEPNAIYIEIWISDSIWDVCHYRPSGLQPFNTYDAAVTSI